MNSLLKVGLRQKAIFIPENAQSAEQEYITPATGLLVANLAKLGFGVTEELLQSLNRTTPAYQATILEAFREVMGVDNNWAPLVKNWSVPVNTNWTDHLVTWLTNIFQGDGVTLRCGHIIPPDTFPLERYNGCPFCGTPFETSGIINFQQGSKIKILELWTTEHAAAYLEGLLRSKTALDATQAENLKSLLAVLPLPDVKPAMKETLMAVIDELIAGNEDAKAAELFSTPTDILRYLWYKHTGFLQLIRPKTIVARKTKNDIHFRVAKGGGAQKMLQLKTELKLKYSRHQGIMVARWLNNLPMEAAAMCEIMHPHRNMWVRFIRALRLAEFSRREGLEHLREMMDKFYRQDYTVWQGTVNHFRLRNDAANTLLLLQQRPGLFARSLFANMLWFGHEPVIAAFAEVAGKVPARLILTLQMYAGYYFDKTTTRAVKPLGGVGKSVAANRLVTMYDDNQLREMQDAVTNLCIGVVQQRFAAVPTGARTIYIAPELHKIPLAIGDRGEQVQDLPGALMGTRFKLAGDEITLFMQWGKGMPAQHLDMDLSCFIAYDKHKDYCSYSRLNTTGCLHSGDIRSIPDQVGTAEYIRLNVAQLAAAGARYVTFTCNAYSQGAIAMNLTLGWMDSKNKITIDEKTGVAYDPSCVDHMVRVTGGLAKGLVFGILDVAAREIIWLEMSFDGQIIQNLDLANVKSILKKLNSKLSIGALLEAKARTQHLQVVSEAEADEVYTLQWALNTAAVTQLLVD
ncbi:hypothetical protein [Chitinophaga sp. 212800010-3]|uniref:hypothetical protein n=1 Tax=unclassified Chitinophaga TaxID=2619133 RepID=UPI002DF28BD9|nr:DUF4132 domain-containing protein [Chitinophaga sp. 212800010-3]